MDSEQIENAFAYHSPTSGKALKHAAVRQSVKVTAHDVNLLCPDCREKSLAITKLEEAIMWANAAIARNPEQIS